MSELATEALLAPVWITLAVLVFGFSFRRSRAGLQLSVSRLAATFGLPIFFSGVVLALGLLSSVITAVISALALVEVVSALRLDRKVEIRLVVLCCYAIGMGAALTPLGEPLSTIATARLGAGSFYLARLLWPWIAAVLAVLCALAYRLGKDYSGSGPGLVQDEPETARSIVLRAIEVYAFVAALVVAGKFVSMALAPRLAAAPLWLLYWGNSISAVVDNATLAAAEVHPAIEPVRLRAVLLGLMLSGGMLIPGNVPNIVAARKLGIKNADWAMYAVPVGLILMLLVFPTLYL